MSGVDDSRRVATARMDGQYAAYIPGSLGHMKSVAVMEWIRTEDEKTGDPIIVISWKTRRYDAAYQTLIVPEAEFRKLAERLGY